MSISKEKSDKIYNRYIELKNSAIYKKGFIQKILQDEFQLPRSTAFDHSRGREKNSKNYKVFQPVISAVTDNKDTKLTQPKTLFFDIETMANLSWVWGKYDQNVIDFEREWYVLCFCYKWGNSDEVNSVSLPDFKESFQKDKTNDYYVVKKMWELFDEADIVIAHNGDQFDIKKMNARFLYHGFPPPSPFKSIDTKKVAKRYFNMNSNKLDDIGRYLGLGRKVVNTGWDLWKRCSVGDVNAWNDMIEYNKMDVILLEKIYYAFRPYMNNHPNMNLYQDTTHNCPNCGSYSLQKRGMSLTRVSKSQRYQCTDCGAYSQGNKMLR